MIYDLAANRFQLALILNGRGCSCNGIDASASNIKASYCFFISTLRPFFSDRCMNRMVFSGVACYFSRLQTSQITNRFFFGIYIWQAQYVFFEIKISLKVHCPNWTVNDIDNELLLATYFQTDILDHNCVKEIRVMIGTCCLCETSIFRKRQLKSWNFNICVILLHVIF